MAGSQKTEKPTPQRLKKAREQGQFPVAKEFVSGFQFLVVAMIMSAWAAGWMFKAQVQFRHDLRSAFDLNPGTEGILTLLRQIAIHWFMPALLSGAMLVAITIALQLVSTGFGVSMAKLKPDMKRFNPLTALKQLPARNGPAVIQTVLLLAVASWAVYTITLAKLDIILSLPLATVRTGASVLATALSDLVWKLTGIIVLFAVVDLVRQRWKFTKNLKMSKQEIKDEHKESEGDPHIKMRVRRMQREMLRRQMMKDVATATAVIVNPTHYAVAIRYEVEKMAAPIAVAKGTDELALRIRQIAVENGVTVIENPPLARALHASVKVGQEIPAEFYRAIAEILAYIYRIMGNRRR